MPLHSKAVLPLWYDVDIVFSHGVGIIARDDDNTFGIISSTIHREWARRCGSSLETRTRYTPSDCFETFPFPKKSTSVASTAKNLDAHRSVIMRKFDVGLTALYNSVNSPNTKESEIINLRQLHADLDTAVCEAYGWSDIDLRYGFQKTDEGVRWAICEETQSEILDRLLELNHQRHAEEVADGLGHANGTPGNGKTKRSKKAAPPVHEQQTSLY